MKNLISIIDAPADKLEELLRISEKLKQLYRVGMQDWALPGKSLIMLFEKPSLRTRVSFEVAMNGLGGSAVYIKPEDIGGMGKREPVKDMARVLSRYSDAIMARTFEHETILELAAHSRVPVINALTDWLHPCQAMADALTMKEQFKSLEGVRFAFVGDGNNVCRSLGFASAKLGMEMKTVSPPGYELDEESIEKANKVRSGSVRSVETIKEAISDAQVIYTDTWVSMGQEEQKRQRVEDFEGYQVNSDMLKLAPEGVKVMHCLPAHRGLEISDEVFESENSLIFEQAENRLHFQRGLLRKLLGPEE